MSRPDVALISPYPVPGSRHEGRSGVASYTANLASALTTRGARVAVVAPREPGAPTGGLDDGVRVERAFGRGAAALPRAARAALHTGAPVVHLQHEFFLYGGPASVPGLPFALGALRSAGAGPVVTMHHAVDAAAVDAGFMKLHRVRAPAAVGRAGLGGVQAAIRALARRVIVHEPLFARWIPRASVIPHGLEPVVDSRAEPSRARESLGLDDGFTALCFGFLAPYKGLEAAIAAAARAAPDVQLVVAGAEHPRLKAARDPYAAQLRAAAPANVRFIGHVPEDRLAALFAATDVALFPYPTVFSSSGALALALAHRTPVLLSPALAGSIDAPAALTAPLEPLALGDRLCELAAEPGALDSLGSASAGLAAGRSWETVADRHLRTYEEVRHARRPAGRLVRTA